MPGPHRARDLDFEQIKERLNHPEIGTGSNKTPRILYMYHDQLVKVREFPGYINNLFQGQSRWIRQEY